MRENWYQPVLSMAIYLLGGFVFAVVKYKDKRVWIMKIDLSDIGRLYLDEKLSGREIANIKGCSDHSIIDNLHKMGIPVRSRAEADKVAFSKIKRKNLQGSYDYSDVAYLYVIKELSAGEIAKVKGCSRVSIENQLKKKGVELRCPREAGLLAFRDENKRCKLEQSSQWKGGV
jgi:predicted DNA-binding protein YlxM (UPF0122 family)